MFFQCHLKVTVVSEGFIKMRLVHLYVFQVQLELQLLLSFRVTVFRIILHKENQHNCKKGLLKAVCYAFVIFIFLEVSNLCKALFK